MPTVPSQSELELHAEHIGKLLLSRGQMLATAESCTGGWAAQCLTAIAGSSAWFDRGFVTYSNAAKQDMLDVQLATLQQHGAVSEATALAMAQGALARSHADWAIAITGIAGPSGGTPEKPVGTVCFAWANREFSACEQQHFQGDRSAIRAQAIDFIFRKLTQQLTHIA